MGGYSGTKEEINQKQREYYRTHKSQVLNKNKGWKIRHLETYRAQRQRYYQNHKEEILEQALIDGLTIHGCCIFCFETNPLLIESHHVFVGEDLQVGLCKNCHHLIHFGHKQRTPEIVRFCNSEYFCSSLLTI